MIVAIASSFSPSFCFLRTQKLFNIFNARMATFTVRGGLNPQRKLPDTQVLIIGRKSLLKAVDFNKDLAEKLTPVSADHFDNAKALLNAGNGSVPLHMDFAKISAIPEDLSRHNTPSNAYTITKEIKAIKLVKGIKNLSIVLFTDHANAFASVVAVARAFPLFSLKSKPESSLENVELEVQLVPTQEQIPAEDIGFLQDMCNYVRNCARLVDMPANILHSEAFLEEAEQMVDGIGVPVEKKIVKGKQLLDLGFGGIYNVGKAATHPPVFACFSHKPSGATESYAFVGKGIVYDTGGLSLKGKLQMPTMKIDMGGAAAVLSAFCSLVKAGFQQNLHCLLCIAENQISPEATRPDDVYKLLSGKTVEVNNTDAEGRLVLADGVFYAKETLKVGTIIDMATLTGAQHTATGKYHAAILCNSDELEAECVKAGRKSGDLVHPLPYAPEMHFGDLNSKVADMKNSSLTGGNGPPSAVAGLFIGAQINFGAVQNEEDGGNASNNNNAASKVNWLHIDMAGQANIEKGERASGYGVALLCSLLGKHTKVGVINSGGK